MQSMQSDELLREKKASAARQGLQLFDASGRVAVPSLAAGALPKMLQCFKAAGGTAVATQGLGRMRYGALYLWLLFS